MPYLLFLKREELVIKIVIANGWSEIVYKRVEKVKKSIKILMSILKSYIASVIKRICNQLCLK